MKRTFDAESMTTLLSLIGVEIAPGRAATAAQALDMLARKAGRGFGALPFEAEPADFLGIRDEQAP